MSKFTSKTKIRSLLSKKLKMISLIVVIAATLVIAATANALIHQPRLKRNLICKCQNV